ncbi:MAG: FecR domain-containing protein [Pseudomonadota bacterium]|nr:FecR domain-containing protein [Pseudomonadota bacterium]
MAINYNYKAGLNNNFEENKTLINNLSANNGKSVIVENLKDFITGNFEKLGNDLILTREDGAYSIIRDYFNFDPPPNLTDNAGISLKGSLIARLSGSLNAKQLAQTNSSESIQEIGSVETLEGNVTAERIDGSIVTLNVGDPVFLGDILVTGLGSSLAVILIDETTFALSEDGEMVLDELIYDPGTGTGSGSFSLLKGATSFVTGQIAEYGDDAMKLDTPVATIGFRGTKVVVAFDPQSSEISIINRPEIQSTGQAEVGQIALFVGGVEVGTVDSSNSGWQFSAGQVPQARTFSEREVSSIGDKVESVVNQITGQRAPSRTNDSDNDENNSEDQASSEESVSDDESQDGESEEENKNNKSKKNHHKKKGRNNKKRRREHKNNDKKKP